LGFADNSRRLIVLGSPGRRSFGPEH